MHYSYYNFNNDNHNETLITQKYSERTEFICGEVLKIQTADRETRIPLITELWSVQYTAEYFMVNELNIL